MSDTYFGETLTDPYRWMENDKDPDWLPFLKGRERACPRRARRQFPGRAALLTRIQQLSGDTAVTGACAARRRTKLFLPAAPCGRRQLQAVRAHREGGGRPRADRSDPQERRDQPHVARLVDAPRRTARTWCTACPRTAARTRPCTSSPWPTARTCPSTSPTPRLAQPQWLDDGSGFFYNQLTGKLDTPERYLDSQARFHRLGTDPAE